MKILTKISFLIPFLIFFSVKSQELSGKITYNVSLNLTVGQVNKRNKELNKITSQHYLNKINNARDILVYLEFDKLFSIYKPDMKLKNDGIRVDNLTQKGAGRDKLYFTENSFIKKNSILECRVLGKCFLIEQPKPIWEISQETKIIGGYLCYRAEYQNPLYKYKKPVAWFTPKIPASYGPKIFTGLPGLILELEDNIVTFTAIKIELNPKEKIVIKKPKGEEITKEKYDVLTRKAHPAFYNKLEKYRNAKKS